MQILSLDLSKYKTVACDYEAETARHSFATVLTPFDFVVVKERLF